MKYVKEIGFTNVVVMTDSQSVLNAQKHRKWFAAVHPMLLDIIMRCTDLKSRGVTIKFFWIKGHIGIIPNEEADALAKLSATEGK